MAFRPIVITVSLDPGLPAFERHGEPVAVGVPCPRGAIARSTRWTLTDQRGRSIPVQTTVLDRWGDGSARWLLTEFRADVDVEPHSFYALAPGIAGADARPAIAIQRAGGCLRVSTGAATIDLPRRGATFISAAEVGGRQVLDSSAIVAEDAQGSRYAFDVRRAAIERAGPQRAVIHLDGALSCTGRRFLDANARLQFFAGLGTVKVDLAIGSPRGAVLIRDLSIRIIAARGGTTDVWGSIDRRDRMTPSGQRFAVHQESSSGPHWNHEVRGPRATPIVSMGGGGTRISVALPYFWEIWPRGLSADAAMCEVAMFPRDGDARELKGGERSTLSMAVCFGRDTVTAQPLAWVRSPLRISFNPLWASERGRPTRRLVSTLARRLAGSRSRKA